MPTLFLVACFFSSPLFIPLFIPESKNFYPSCPIFLYSFYRQRYNNGVTFFFLIFAPLFRMEGGRFLQKSLSFTTKKYRFMTQKSLTFDECKQLSSRIIAMNPNRRANMGQISSHLLDYYAELTKQPWLAQLVGQIRDLTAQQNQMMQEEMKAGETYQQLDRKITDLKKQLPFRSPHYFHFLEDHRAQKFIDPEAFTFQTTVDIDNPEEVEPAVKNALLLNGIFDEPTEKLFREKIFSAEDIELWKGKVLHIERSARNKAHIDIRIPVGMTIAEAQSAFCKLIHATEDPSCVTPERIIFITDAASQIYTADDWYKRLDKEAVAEYREAYRKRGLDIDDVRWM